MRTAGEFADVLARLKLRIIPSSSKQKRSPNLLNGYALSNLQSRKH